MGATRKQTEQEWLKEQLEDFKEALPRYRVCARVLHDVLEKAARLYAPLSIVQTRHKSVVSFGEKAVQKKRVRRYSDPINRMTDLCGGRIIVPTKKEVITISDFIKKNFDVDTDNSVDVSQRLRVTEFGYRGVHYIVQFKPGVFPTKEIDVRIPREIFGLKSEIQVKTILEHGWGVFTHDRAYKGAFKIPGKWEREMAALAATLEEADNSFARIEDGLKRYASSYSAYMSEDDMGQLIDNLKVILEYDSDNSELAARIGKLAITLGDWNAAVEILSKYADSKYPPVLRDLGIAICKSCAEKPSESYSKGQGYLKAALKMNPSDTDAISSLAGTYRGIDDNKACELYKQAFEIDPSDPYSLGNHLECEINRHKDGSSVVALRSLIENAVSRCRDQADVGMNLPWAFYDMGKFNLLLGKPFESLAAYSKALHLSHTEFMIETAIESLEKLNCVSSSLVGFEWIRRLLLLGLAVEFPQSNAGMKAVKKIKGLASKANNLISGPVTIVAGGCDASAEKKIQAYRQLMLDGFWDFHGTIISGGTKAGISGIVGDIGSEYPDAIYTIGYLPHKLQAGTRKDVRYREIRDTGGTGISPMQPLQYWTDIIASGLPLTRVRVMGVNGGDISAAEYRIALALGAQVAVINNSGGEATRLIADRDWANVDTLISVPADRMTIAAYLRSASSRLSPKIRELVARAIHNNYRAGKIRVSSTDDPASSVWEELPYDFKKSDLLQADDISNKLKRTGYKLAKASNSKAARFDFTDKEIEIMAEMEHGRWNIERLLGGWKPGDRRSAANKVSPYLAAWDELPEEVKEWDRDTVRKIPKFISTVRFEVQLA